MSVELDSNPRGMLTFDRHRHVLMDGRGLTICIFHEEGERREIRENNTLCLNFKTPLSLCVCDSCRFLVTVGVGDVFQPPLILLGYVFPSLLCCNGWT